MARPPKPTALKLIAGNPGKRSLNKQEPDPTYLQDLTPPAWLSDAAKQVWSELAPAAVAAKLLTEVDVEPFAMGCVAIAQYRLATGRTGEDAVKRKLAVDDKGNAVTDENGQPVYAGEHINPWALVQSMSFKQAMLVFDKFGMTPQARTRIAVQPQGDLFGEQKTGAASYFS
ncbi:P27 family phage terminase small subunit [Polaromonas jejuensis]|uniref:P27 family phage terminase small subunit n=1 Tax=Polaromonas jejuensis TaxID=457502 RepID=A0ABW0QK91_9BURK|nr:P27 family phage terminase small subunit [Polaromonas jejuensis]